MNPNTSLTAKVPTGKIRIISWVLRLMAATAFLSAGSAKLAGVEMMVGVYEQIGIGQWFRIVTGVVEVVGAVALFVPRYVVIGSLLLAVTMLFAALTHLLIIGGSAHPAFALLVVTGAISWIHRPGIPTQTGRL